MGLVLEEHGLEFHPDHKLFLGLIEDVIYVPNALRCRCQKLGCTGR